MEQEKFSAKSCPTATEYYPASSRPAIPRLRLIAIVLLTTLLLAACGGSDAPSSDQEDAPAAADTATPVPEPDPTDTPEPAPTDTPMPEPTDTPVPEPEPTDTPEAEPEPAPTAAPMEESESAEGPGMGQVFVIVAEESEARFSIDEELLGQPKTVVGVTNAISGEIKVDAANPAASVIGPIQIEAGTFVTDNDQRNRAIRRFILQSNRHQYITFSSTELSGMPDSVAVGDEVEFEVTGDLTVREVTNPVLFIVTLRVISESELSGSAATILVVEDYELRIPDVPSVANVGEEFIVEFDFVARTQ
ncbi:MAG: YceI family protein [Caldilineaceae bacterium]|nr:YceI family protein [Caldilineaceae bacterium]MDE0337507.1 YceI family protein [Caldilineaceae bacterium]